RRGRRARRSRGAGQRARGAGTGGGRLACRGGERRSVIVVDASVLATMLVYGGERGRNARMALGRDTEWAAPEHWQADVFSVVRGLALACKIDEGPARQALNRLPRLAVDHVSLDGLLPRMGELPS